VTDKLLASLSVFSLISLFWESYWKFWEEHGPQRKQHLQQFFVAAGTFLPSCFLAMIVGYTGRPTGSSLGGHRPQKFFYCCMQPSPRERVYRAVAWQRQEGYTDRWEGFMQYAIEMGSEAMIYIPSSINIVSGIQKLMGGIHRLTDRMMVA
jgi:hypothetical protein